MAKLKVSAEMLEQLLFGGPDAGLHILGAEYDQSQGMVMLNVEGKDCPEGDTLVEARLRKINGINGSAAIIFDGLHEVK